MYSKGIYKTDNEIRTVFVQHDNSVMTVLLAEGYNVVSGFINDGITVKCFNDKKAQNVANIIKKGLSKCNSKNKSAVPFALGTATVHKSETKKVNYTIYKYEKCFVGCYIESEEYSLDIEYDATMDDKVFNSLISGLNFVKVQTELNTVQSDDEDIKTRSLEEIALEKDITWLKDKKYYVVNDDEVAEQILSIIDNMNCVVAYDTETTGLKMNVFSKINSKYKKELEEYNRTHQEKIKADSLVGIIFCVEDNISYYFPVGNRKFKNLYETDTPVRRRLVEKYKAEYTVGAKHKLENDIGRYWRETPADKIPSDVILMERCRNILTTKHIVAHNGSFEWKVSYCYDIDLNLCDDTMIMHQLMYKFRSTTSNRGEPSNLKYLTKRELGIDQLDLKDFFTEYQEDKEGLVKGGKKRPKIDFSYMDYLGSQAYAPADGDTTLQIFKKYYKDMQENHKDIIYLYQIELVVACAIAYMEFYGLKMDEARINDVCEDKKTELLEIELSFRESVGQSTEKEQEMRVILDKLKEELSLLVKEYNKISEDLRSKRMELIKEFDNKEIALEVSELEKSLAVVTDNKIRKQKEIGEYREQIRDVIEGTPNYVNLGSPMQVATLFFDDLGIECSDQEKRSVNKKVLKALKGLKNDDGTLKYPMIKLYSDWKNTSTLITKFFDKLPQFMFPGGYIFPSFGQISTATGRMSCLDEDTMITVVGKDKKAIKDIQKGDLVYCYTDSGDIKVSRVLNTIDQGVKECLRLEFSRDSIVCTPDHRVRLSDGNWVQAKDIQPDDRVVLYDMDTKIIRYERCLIENIQEERHVYDLEVETYHNFIANNVIVHNCSKPNAQQFCKAVTGLVIPRDNNIMIDADFSQIEYRTLVAMANEPALIEKFKDPDNDYHTTMASLMFGVPYASVTKKMRSDAKSFNFGIPYGMGFKSLAILLSGIGDKAHQEEAKEKYKLYFKDQPNVKAFFDRVKESALLYKYTETLWGRRRYYSFVNEDGTVSEERKGFAMRQAGNAIIQGCLDGNTLINTKEFGIKPISELVDTHLEVWDGEKWSEGDILYSGKKKKCIVYLENGQEIICSPIHKFLVLKEGGSEEFIECQYLKDKFNSDKPSKVIMSKGFSEHSGIEAFRSFLYHSVREQDGEIKIKVGRGNENRCRTIQRELMFYNIKSSIEKDVVSTTDIEEFNKLMHRGEGIFKCKTLEVSKVEITEEWIDMYDVCNTDRGYYVANGVITHNTAADIFKISVARNFSFIRRNNLLGKVLIVNMIHDEQLMEIDCNTVNPLVCYKNIADNMQFSVDGFPPLFIGAGFGFNWNYAKGGDAEIHPDLCKQLCSEANGYSLMLDRPVAASDVFNFFQGRVNKFREDKVRNYMQDSKNWGQKLHPVIGSLLASDFTYGLQQGKDETEEDYQRRLIEQFIEKNNVKADVSYFSANEVTKDQEEEKEYFDDDEDDIGELEVDDRDFVLVDESDKMFGASIIDLINQFGYFVSVKKRVCGVKLSGLSKKRVSQIADYLQSKVVDKTNEGSMEVCFLMEGNILKRSNIYVSNIDANKIGG